MSLGRKEIGMRWIALVGLVLGACSNGDKAPADTDVAVDDTDVGADTDDTDAVHKCASDAGADTDTYRTDRSSVREPFVEP